MGNVFVNQSVFIIAEKNAHLRHALVPGHEKRRLEAELSPLVRAECLARL